MLTLCGEGVTDEGGGEGVYPPGPCVYSILAKIINSCDWTPTRVGCFH
jgi:hypothetical protein